MKNADFSSFTSASPFGVWKFVSYSDGKAVPYEVTLELTSQTDEKGLLLLNGKSSVNFYFSTYEIDFTKKTLKFGQITSTKINGSAEALQFETLYFQRLAQTIGYSISSEGSQLILTLPDAAKTIMAFQKKNV